VKLAFVHRRFGLDGGTERFLESLTRRLGQRGHEIEVWTAGVDPRFARTRVAAFRKLRAGRRGLLRNLLLFLAAKLQVKRARFDAVLHLGRTGPLDIYRAGGGCHRTWYELLRSRATTGWQRFRLALSPAHRFRLWHERKALRAAGRFVVPSETARADLVRAYGPVADRVEVLHNGVDLDRFHPRTRQLFFEEERQRLGLRPEELVLLFVGSDFWRKGLDTLLRATGRLEEAGDADELRLLVVGGDRRTDEYAALAERLGVRGRVTFLRHHDAPEKVYAAADVFALPTRHDPFANVTIEALASGLPVVTSAINGATEAVEPGLAFSVLDDAEDDEGLAAVLRDLLRPERFAERRAAAREAASSCGEGACVDRWEQLLKDVSGGRRG
jgi:UDP-glucose:(heptosyl)LPS alpha-1,3-glucosyltransferase